MKHWFLPTPQNGYRAFLLRTPALVLMLVVLLIGNNLVGIIPIQQVGAEISLATLLNMHNTERTKRGLPPFKLNAALSNSAQQKAVVMLENDCWSHYCPQGKSPWDFVLNAGYPYLFAGENLAQGFTDNEATMVAWMDSPTHRDNILRPEFEDIGFGIVQGSFQGYNSNVIIVVHFGTPQPNSDTLLSTSRRDLPTPTITSPRDGIYIGEPVIDVQGRAEQASQVGIIKDGIEWVKVDVRDGAFTYRSPELADGVYQLNA
ncbi:MAG: hypothetical protein JNK26_00755 [Candidatus Doudnabacteria bacterium]|nr:hypothetical protein [Candidatus Doudnabacteria bacterium]